VKYSIVVCVVSEKPVVFTLLTVLINFVAGTQ